jgi:hypothetical protein
LSVVPDIVISMLLVPQSTEPGAVEALDASATLRFAAGAQAAEQAARVSVLEAAARWADLHGALDDAGSVVLPGAERLVQIGGGGTPMVAEFCPAELGAVLAMSTYAASRLIGDALDLRHRLPLLWARIRVGQVKAWIGQQAAQATRDLSAEFVAEIDRAIAPYAHGLGWTRLEAIIQGIIIDVDPAAASDRAEQAALAQGVWVGQSTEHGIKDIHIKTEAPNAIWFDATIDRIADSLAALGDPDHRDVRRAKAVGIIAQPQTTLDLFRHTITVSDGAERPVESSVGPGEGGDDSVQATSVRREPSVDPRPPATLYIHVSDQALTGATQVGRFEGIGPVLKDQIRTWLRGCHVTIKPVIDLDQQIPVDAYEIPPRLRETTLLRSPTDMFPYGSNSSRSMDFDHTIPYISPDTGGPPGQTRLDNIAPLTRRHHRIKTHGRWQVAQPFNGVLVWKSPHGHHYLVDHTGTQQANIP